MPASSIAPLSFLQTDEDFFVTQAACTLSSILNEMRVQHALAAGEVGVLIVTRDFKA
jgi:hypothetical protein